jgi:hypothetical protein
MCRLRSLGSPLVMAPFALNLTRKQGICMSDFDEKFARFFSHRGAEQSVLTHLSKLCASLGKTGGSAVTVITYRFSIFLLGR